MIEHYLKEQYDKTHWPFFKSADVFNRFIGELDHDEIRKQLNDLFLSGKVRKRDSVTGNLIELII